MKRIILAISVIAALTTGCSKPSTNAPSFGTFSYGGTSYTVIAGTDGPGNSSSNIGYNLIGTASVPAGGVTAPTMYINFKTRPTTSGNYDVRDGSGSPGTTGCTVIYTSSNGVRYLSTNGTSQNVAVTVSGSTITAIGTGITLEEDNNSSNSGTAAFNFHN